MTPVDEDLPLTPPPALGRRGACLFLDVDGTLAPFEDDPAAVKALPRRTAALLAVSRRLRGRVAAISGRPVSEIDRILDRSIVAAAGLHGLERRDADDSFHPARPHGALPCAVAAFEDLARAWSGLLVETKGASVALHYRRRPELAARLNRAADVLARRSGLEVRRGAMVVELRTPGPDKGDAVRAFMAQKPFQGGRAIFVGDDLTDEDGFAAAAALGGFGILVGPPRATRAAFRLNDVDAVLSWLEGSGGRTHARGGAHV